MTLIVTLTSSHTQAISVALMRILGPPCRSVQFVILLPSIFVSRCYLIATDASRPPSPETQSESMVLYTLYDYDYN